MMKLLRFGLWSSLVLLLAFPLRGQELVQLGKHRLSLPSNVQTRFRGVSELDLGSATGGERNVLIQLTGLLSAAERAELRAKGLELDDYLGSGAYWARLRVGVEPRGAFRGTKLRSVVPVESEWKISELLEPGRVPAWSRVGHDRVRVNIHYASNADSAGVHQALERVGFESLAVYGEHGLAVGEVQESLLGLVASMPWVRMVSPVSAPRELLNATGRSLGRGNYLSLSSELGGRGLNGEGMRVGIWDGNVAYSPDFGNRVHRNEFQLASGGGDSHGTHVAGTVLGSGMLDPEHRGVAPKAQGWSWNFATGLPGQVIEPVEMELSHRRDGITITQNSYGLPLERMCILYPAFSYNTMYDDLLLDKSTTTYPTLLHVYAAGNEQQGCLDTVLNRYGVRGYGTSGNRTKNALHIGAVDLFGRMTQFSSWGPMDDGRLVPTVVAKGLHVRSVSPFDGYRDESGTSMACPMTTGHLVLVGQRYRQLNQGRDIRADLQRALVANTATDLGNRGPDFQYGYGMVNAEKMVLSLERGWYLEGEKLEGGGSFERTIEVPRGATQARVMVVWNDPSVVKEYKWGDKALVNDLDLTVDGLQPWVCNHQKERVEDPAQRRVDRLNNMEQVTLSASELEGKSSLTIRVKGHEVPMGPQQFALVWWFEVPGAFRITAPAGGEAFQPGETLVVHVEDIADGPFVVDLSYDGGVTFPKVLARTKESYTVFRPEIPQDAPVSSQAVLRVVDAKGNVAKSNPFSIAPVVSEIALDRGTDVCGSGPWELSWTAPIHGEATHGYKLLLGDVATESWEELSSIAKDATSMDISTLVANKLQNRTSALLTIAAAHADGTWGRRAKALQVFAFANEVVTPEGLPFAETFEQWPSPRWVVYRGAQRTFDVNPYSDVTVPNGSNVVYTGVVATNPEQEFNTEAAPFDAVNKDFHVELRMCRLDLSAFPAGTKLLLRLTGAVISGDPDSPESSLMRVLLDDQPLQDLRGKEVHEAKDTDFELMYPIEVDGGVHSLSIQHSGYVITRNAQDRMLLTGIYLEREEERSAPDISLSITKTPVDGTDLGVERFELTLINSSIRTHQDVEVKAKLNGEWVASQRIERVLGSDELRFWFPLDLSTSEPNGVIWDVEFEAVCPGDAYPEDNKASTQVANLGQLIRMPESFYLSPDLDPAQAPQDPNLRYTIGKEMRIFTDNGGLLRPHGIDQNATITFLPEDPSMRVRVVFRSFKTQVRQGILDIYTNLMVHEGIENALPIDQLDGEITEKDLEELVFVSGSRDGSIRFYFNSTKDLKAVDEGWVAEVDLVPLSNPLSLTGVKIELQGADPVADVPVEVKVRNNTQRLVPMARLRVADGALLPVTVPMQNVVLGEQTDVLPSRVTGVPMRTAKQLVVELLAPDGDMSDNRISTWMVYDRYCIPHWKPGVNKAIVFSPDTVKMFEQAGEMDLELRYIEHDAFVHSSIWIDWDGNGEFGEAEQVQSGEVDLYQSGGSLPFKASAKGKAKGEYRLRAIYGKTAAQVASPCPTALDEETDVRDVIVVVREGDHPTAGDVALTYVGASEPTSQKGFVSSTYGADEPVWIEVTNASYRSWSGKLEVSVSVDGATPVVEEVEVPSDTPLEAWSGRMAFKLKAKADMSQHGKHTISVTIRELDGRGSAENNQEQATLYTLRPPSDGEWALYSQLHPDPSVPNRPNGVFDVVTLESAATALYNAIPRDGKGQMTIEMWLNSALHQYGEFFAAEGLRISVTNRMQAKEVRDNGLFLAIGSRMAAYTENPDADLIMPGQWHHVAFVFDELSPAGFQGKGYCKVNIYVDGSEANTQVQGEGSPSLRGLINLLPTFEGKLDQLRLWSRALSGVEVAKFMHMNVTTSASEAERKGLVAEYGFNEGPHSAGTVSQQDHLAIINTMDERIADGVWSRPFDKLLERTEFSGQVLQHAQEDGVIAITFAQGTDLGNVQGATFETVWPGTIFTYEGAPITPSTQFDFSDGKQVKVKAVLNSYGGELTEEITFVGQVDLSNACDILSLQIAQSDNPGFPADVDVAVEPSMVVQADGVSIPHPQRVKLRFTVSDGATLYAQVPEGLVELSSGVTELDLSQERILTVVAANERTHQDYSLRLGLEQSLTWSEPQSTYVYGAQPVDLQLQSATLALNPVVSTSLHPNVASVNGGRLHIGAVGSTTISFHQPGTNGYRATDRIEKEITVTPKEVLLGLKESPLKGGEEPAWQFAYEGILNATDEALMPDPMEHGDFSVERNGVAVDYQTEGFRELGEYTLKVKGTPYAVGNYIVKPVESKFRVVQGDRYRFVVTARVSGQPLKEALVSVAGQQLVTDAEGKAIFWLLDSATYPYTVSKPNHSVHTGEVVIASADATAEVTLRPSTVWYRYKSGAGGQVYGELEQHLAEGQSSTPILVQAAEGYQFTAWSDGVTLNPRVDVAGSANAEYEAQFALREYTLSYVAGANGSIEGQAQQRVQFSKSGSAVKAVPAAGYHFVVWSDGHTSATRTDADVRHDAEVVPIFRKMQPLPYVCTFDGREFEQDWAHTSVGKTVIPWEVTAFPRPLGDRLDGHYAMVDADQNVRADFESVLYSPRFALPSGGVSGGLDVSFDMFYRDNDLVKAELYLEYDSGDGWHEVPVGKLFPLAFRSSVTRTLAAADLSGKSYVQFRIRYKTTWSYWVLVDNFAVFASSADAIVVNYVSEPEDAGHFFTLEGQEVGRQEQMRGWVVDQVVARAKPGYKFAGWADGWRDSVRPVEPFVDHVNLVARFVPDSKYVVRYRASLPDAVRFVVDGEEITEQWFSLGDSVKSVKVEVQEGYKFSHWLDNHATELYRDEEILDGDTERVAVVVSRSMIETVPSMLSWRVDPAEAGSLSVLFQGLPVTKETRLDVGDEVKISYTVNKGYLFKRLLFEEEDSVVPTLMQQATFILPAKATLVAQYEQEESPAPAPDPTPDPEPNHTSVEDAVLRTLVVSPNPTSGSARVSGILQGDRLSLFDAMGHAVWSSLVVDEGSEYAVDLTDRASGVYLLRVDRDGRSYSIRIVRQ